MRGQVVRITKKENLKLGELHNCHFNEERDFKIFHTYTAYKICKIFNKEGYAFIPFICNYCSVYDGIRKLKEEELRDLWIYIANMQYEDCLVHH